MTRFIAVLGKGGAGKTTISINLAVALKNLGKDVILLDANMTNPDIGLYLGIGKLPITLSQVFKNNRSIYESIYLHSSGIKLIPSEGLEEISSDKLKSVFNSLKGAAEIVLIDTGAFTEEMLNLVDEVLIISGSDMASVTQASKIKKMAEEKNITVLGIVLNRFNKFGFSIAEIERILEMPSLITIYESDDIKTAILNNQAIVNYYPRVDISQNFSLLAKKIGGEFVEKESFFDYIMKGVGLR